jgi:hypothetical protein
MTAVSLHAILPAPDGTGWYAVQPTDTPYTCSRGRCKYPAVAYLHTIVDGERINDYRCHDHLIAGMEIRGGRVWRDGTVTNGPNGP